MKKILIALCAAAVLASCNGNAPKQTAIDKDVKEMTFEEIFQRVDSAAVKQTLASLMAAEEHPVITAGTPEKFNSMAASWEALGRYFEKPGTLCLLGAGRYTLEFIRERQTYTMTFLPGELRSELIAFGTRSGRNSNKMEETKLTAVETPSGNMTYKEASVVIELRLFEITTVQPSDFYNAEGRKFVEDALAEAGDYHKLVFGTITNIWIKK